ncbi:hypothetical protein AAFF_G00299340 [Aldrovandia affinis]|uniref:Uncharacterized protein n=1 Tax=Aldrovandia affinis TaxID=143900 RepID=A0AAD7W1K0_9TELE|nr:hypothetical protein AAFF_G00299340 [Aldrovandia affinis]
MIYGRRQHRKKDPTEEGGRGVLYVNNYLDRPTICAQLEEHRDGRVHQMYVLDCSRPVFPPPPAPSYPIPHPPAEMPRRVAGDSGEAEPEALFLNQSLLFDTQVAYEIHC